MGSYLPKFYSPDYPWSRVSYSPATSANIGSDSHNRVRYSPSGSSRIAAREVYEEGSSFPTASSLSQSPIVRPPPPYLYNTDQTSEFPTRSDQENGRYILPEPKPVNSGASTPLPGRVSYASPALSSWAIESQPRDRETNAQSQQSRHLSGHPHDPNASYGHYVNGTASPPLLSEGAQASHPHSRASSGESQYASASSAGSNPNVYVAQNQSQEYRNSSSAAVSGPQQSDDKSTMENHQYPSSRVQHNRHNNGLEHQYSAHPRPAQSVSSKSKSKSGMSIDSMKSDSTSPIASSSDFPGHTNISGGIPRYAASRSAGQNSQVAASSVLSRCGSTSGGGGGGGANPVIQRLNGLVESLQQRRPARTTLSLARLTSRRSSPDETDDIIFGSPSVLGANTSDVGLRANSPSPQQKLNGRSSSSSTNASPSGAMSEGGTVTAIPVDDSCSKCGVRASVLVEYTKVKEELQTKKKQWEAYFADDHLEKAKLKEEIANLGSSVSFYFFFIL